MTGKTTRTNRTASLKEQMDGILDRMRQNQARQTQELEKHGYPLRGNGRLGPMKRANLSIATSTQRAETGAQLSLTGTHRRLNILVFADEVVAGDDQ